MAERNVQKDEPPVIDRRKDLRVRKSLRYSVTEGAFAAAMVGFGETFFLPFALLLKANTLQVGLIGALPQALGSLLQFFSNALITSSIPANASSCQARCSRPSCTCRSGFAFFLGEHSVWLLLLFTCLYFGFGMMVNPAWNSWMGDLVVENRRGAYFGRRSKVTSTSAFISR